MNSKFFFACIISISIITESCAMQRRAGFVFLGAGYGVWTGAMVAYAKKCDVQGDGKCPGIPGWRFFTGL